MVPAGRSSVQNIRLCWLEYSGDVENPNRVVLSLTTISSSTWTRRKVRVLYSSYDTTYCVLSCTARRHVLFIR